VKTCIIGQNLCAEAVTIASFLTPREQYTEINLWRKSHDYIGRETVFLTQWIERYENCINGVQASQGIQEFRSLVKDKKLILYGAGVIGKQLADLFKAWEINIFSLIDKNYELIAPVNGMTVHAPDRLKYLEVQPNYVVISAAANMQISEYIKEDFYRLGIKYMTLIDGYLLHRALQNLVCTNKFEQSGSLDMFGCTYCSRHNYNCPIFLKCAEALCGPGIIRTGNVSNSFNMVDYTLGHVCTLNCQHCDEGIPYIEKKMRSFVPPENVIADIRKIATASRMIVRMDFGGGEPLLHPDFTRILKESIQISNIASFVIFSNGTITPEDELCEIMKNPRVMLSLSSYWKNLGDKHREKVKKTKEKLQQYGVRYTIGENKSWFDFTSFEPVYKENPNEAFANCFLRCVHRLHDGILYPCVHSYAGVMTGATPIFEKECLNIRNISETDLPNELDRLKSMTTYMICQYCPLPYNAKEVSAGIQYEQDN